VTLTFAAWLKQRREMKGMSQEELGLAAGFQSGRTNISKFEKSGPGYVPRLDALIAICKALDTTLDDPLVAMGLLDRPSLFTSPDEETIIHILRALDERGRTDLSNFAKTLAHGGTGGSSGRQKYRVKAPLVKAAPALTRNKGGVKQTEQQSKKSRKA
jgi:transcriptional regulator with XRE-family HTH domain